MTCAKCGYTIHPEDGMKVIPWAKGGGFDYRHADCNATRQLSADALNRANRGKGRVQGT